VDKQASTAARRIDILFMLTNQSIFMLT